MSERKDGGPIRRKRRDKDADEAPAKPDAADGLAGKAKAAAAAPADEPAPGTDAGPADAPRRAVYVPGGEGDGGGPTVIRRSLAGRRVFEPDSPRRTAPAGGERGGPRSGPPRGRGGPPQGGGDRRGGPPGRGGDRRGGPAARGARPVNKALAKAAEQDKARQLAEDKGIPQVHALRVVREEVTLNDVLKALMRKERAARLVELDGLEPGLAGQVASGHLTRERALELQRIRAHRAHRIDRDALKIAEVEQLPVGILAFDGEWKVGIIGEARTYEFDFRSTDDPTVTVIQKHDVKMVCRPEAIPGLLAAAGQDERLKTEGLAGTADREERIRPGDSEMLDLIEAGTPVSLIMRDGERYDGLIRSFGRWDLELEVDGGHRANVLFHALHKKTSWPV